MCKSPLMEKIGQQVGTLDNSAFEKTITFDKTLTKYVRIVLTEGRGTGIKLQKLSLN